MFNMMKIIFAGGGTGGHLFPGIAVAREFLKQDTKTEITFIVAGLSIEKSVLTKERFRFLSIPVRGIKGKGIKGLVKGLLFLPIAFIRTIIILIKERPDIVIGLGGYSSGPVILSSCLLKIPSVIQEQNIIPGTTNILLSRFVKAIAISYSSTSSYFKNRNTYLTGNPVRVEFLSSKKTNNNIGRKVFNILIFGGSQGAKKINTVMINTLDRFCNNKEMLHFVHQTGIADHAWIEIEYKNRHISAEVIPFINDMADRFYNADIIICRAGATTIAELAVAGKAAILIPYPFAANDHQRINAEYLYKNDAAEMLTEDRLTAENLYDLIMSLVNNRDKIRQMETNISRLATPDASARIVDMCYSLLKGN